MIIALGESIVAIGIGAAGIDLGGRVVLAAILGVVVSAALWWSYFDVVAIVAERKMTEAKGVARSRIARDSYSYLHLPMVAGIILLALGMKKTIGHVDEPLELVPAVALCGGVALYLPGPYRVSASQRPQRELAATRGRARMPRAHPRGDERPGDRRPCGHRGALLDPDHLRGNPVPGGQGARSHVGLAQAAFA